MHTGGFSELVATKTKPTRLRFDGLGMPCIVVGVLLLTSCATLYKEEDEPGCKSDKDCSKNEVCANDQGGKCVAKSRPRRGALAFVLDTPQNTSPLRIPVEFRGCDMCSPNTNDRLRVDRKQDFIADFQLNPNYDRAVDECRFCSEGLEQCVDSSACRHTRQGPFKVRRLSRIGRPNIEIDLTLPEPDEDAESILQSIPFSWPCSHEFDAPFLVLAPSSITPVPTLSAAIPAQIAAVLLQCDRQSLDKIELNLPNIPFSESGIRFYTRLIGSSSQSSEQRLSVNFIHNDSIGTSATITGSPKESLQACEIDENCLRPGMICGLEGTCGPDLKGLLAAETSAIPLKLTDTQIVFTEAFVHSYSSAEKTTVNRNFLIEYGPAIPSQAGEVSSLPRMRVPVSVELNRNLADNRLRGTIEKGLCIPDWKYFETPIPIRYKAWNEDAQDLGVGSAVQLTPEHRCCDSTCLTKVSENQMVCAGQQLLNFRSGFQLSETERARWETADCILPEPSPEDGFYETRVECSDGTGSCSVQLPYGVEDECRDFDLKMESPESSVFRSRWIPNAFKVCRKNVPKAELTDPLFVPRIIFRGKVTCDSRIGGDCDPSEATIMAERLVLSDEDPNRTIGPYFFAQNTLSEEPYAGQFMMPIEPGVYVTTALPPSGRPGGPAPYRILDLRENSPLLVQEGPDGILATDPNHPDMDFPLLPGSPVKVQFTDAEFDLGSTLLPLDFGSWRSNEFLQNYDFNSPFTCWPLEEGCRIRALRRPQWPSLQPAPIPFDLARNVQFTAREGGDSNCHQTDPGILLCQNRQ